MKVLVVGYGRMGRIKSALWRSLKCTVYVYDPDPVAIIKALNDGYQAFEKLKSTDEIIADICSPADNHVTSLEWLVSRYANMSKILIEKPLASSSTEIEDINRLVSNNPNLKPKIVLSESYYSSAALVELRKHLADFAEIKKIIIELSKNRLNDIKSGRFYDNNLEAIGIEVPHAIAILQSLDVNLDNLINARSILHSKNNEKSNQYYELIHDGKPKIQIVSSLGDFVPGIEQVANSVIMRRVIIETEMNILSLEFDPVMGLPRYYSKIKIYENGKTILSETVADNHLLSHLKKVLTSKKLSPHLGLDNAILISELLIKLKVQAEKRSQVARRRNTADNYYGN